MTLTLCQPIYNTYKKRINLPGVGRGVTKMKQENISDGQIFLNQISDKRKHFGQSFDLVSIQNIDLSFINFLDKITLANKRTHSYIL